MWIPEILPSTSRHIYTGNHRWHHRKCTHILSKAAVQVGGYTVWHRDRIIVSEARTGSNFSHFFSPLCSPILKPYLTKKNVLIEQNIIDRNSYRKAHTWNNKGGIWLRQTPNKYWKVFGYDLYLSLCGCHLCAYWFGFFMF